MNLNKNISVWRGNSVPPTDYHLWEKEDGSIYTKVESGWIILTSPNDKATLDKIKIITTELANTQIRRTEMGVANGVATLDNNGVIPYNQLPNLLYTSIDKLNDTVYPITLGFTVSPNTDTMQTDVKYSVTSDGKPLVPDTLQVTKQINDNASKVLTNAEVASGTVQTKIEGSREIFKFAVTKTGRTGKSTSATRYLCYYGSSSVKDMTTETMDTLSKVSSTGVSFNPQINTNNGEYIWLIVPDYLTISRVTSAGVDVTLAAVQTVTNSLGTFKAYRTANTLTTETWKLVIS